MYVWSLCEPTASTKATRPTVFCLSFQKTYILGQNLHTQSYFGQFKYLKPVLAKI